MITHSFAAPHPPRPADGGAGERLLTRILADPQLPSLPALALQVLETAARPDCTVAEVTELISRDPALCGKVLKAVNSALYNLPHAVSSVSRAVGLLGLTSVRSLVLALSLSAVRVRGVGQSAVQEFWRSSVVGAVVALETALHLRRPFPEDDFVAGLLRDLGVLAFHQACPAEYPLLWQVAAGGPAAAQGEMERQAFGLDHAEVGARILECWRLPAGITQAIRCRHAGPDRLAALPPAVAERARLLAFADRAARLQRGAGPAGVAELKAYAREHYQLDEAALLRLLAPVDRKMAEFATVAQLDIGSGEAYTPLLAQAAEELVKLAVEASLSGLREREGKRQAEQEARRWQQAAHRLQRDAAHDALTGVLNRGGLQEALARKFRTARRSGALLGLVFVDLDDFKILNDRFGHPFGDQALKEVAAALCANVRDADVVARYGGDEFCVLFTHAAEDGLEALPRRLHEAINGRTVRHAGRIARVGVSVGAVTCFPAGMAGGPDELLAEADRAMYLSKKSGKNRLSLASLLAPADRAVLEEVRRRLFSVYLAEREGVHLPPGVQRRYAPVRGGMGGLARRLGWITPAQLRAVLLARRASRQPFDAAARAAGLLSRGELYSLRAVQQERPEELARRLVEVGALQPDRVRPVLDRYYAVVRRLTPLGESA
jgi:diguanylate cyclase (GGDEF)-like protein